MMIKLKKSEGFTLIEILIAIAVAAVILPGIVILLSLSTFTTSQGETYTKGYALAQRDMEIIYSEKSEDWDAFSAYAADGSLSEDILPAATPGITEEISSSIVDTDKILVNVKIFWNERGETDWTTKPKISIESLVTNH